jgi:hypothetical protein
MNMTKKQLLIDFVIGTVIALAIIGVIKGDWSNVWKKAEGIAPAQAANLTGDEAQRRVLPPLTVIDTFASQPKGTTLQELDVSPYNVN